MSKTQGSPSEGKSPSLGRSGVKRAVQVIVQLALTGVVLFVSAGRLDWTMGWVLIGLYILILVFNAFFIFWKNPEVVTERSRWGSKRTRREPSAEGAYVTL